MVLPIMWDAVGDQIPPSCLAQLLCMTPQTAVSQWPEPEVLWSTAAARCAFLGPKSIGQQARVCE